MASTSDLAPNRNPETTTAAPTSGAAGTTARASRTASKGREAQLEEQVAQLQNDLKGIASTLARLSNEKVNEVRDVAKSEVRHLQRQGQHVVEDVQEQASALEQQLKDTIRQKPLTAVASAVGIGFILAMLSRH